MLYYLEILARVHLEGLTPLFLRLLDIMDVKTAKVSPVAYISHEPVKVQMQSSFENTLLLSCKVQTCSSIIIFGIYSNFKHIKLIV